MANNGSGFNGLSGNTLWYNTSLGIAMLLGRFMMILPMLAIAGNLAGKKQTPATLGTFPGDRTVIHGSADRRGGDRGCADIFPGAQSGADSRTPC